MDAPDTPWPQTDLADLTRQRPHEAMELNQRYLNRQLGRVVQTLGFDRDWVRGEGSYLIDRDGDRYLDLVSGHGMFALGRSHPYVKQQLHGMLDADTPSLVQIGVSTYAGVLAEELVRRAPESIEAVVFSNSGTESVEAALKFARAATGRPRIVFCDRGFHGLSMGSLSINGNEEFRDRFGELLPGCVGIPFGDVAALTAELNAGDVAAFVVEPIQGKGVHVAPEGYLRSAQELCHRNGTLLVLDEVQTGIGRTGRFLAAEHWDLQPDMITLSKALSGGYVPIGALLTSRAVYDATFNSMENSVVHSSTFAGGDFAAAAALATLRVIDHDDLVTHAVHMGNLLTDLTNPFEERFEIVQDVRGMGLMWAIGLGRPKGAVAGRVWDAAERRQPGLFAQMLVLPLFHEHKVFTQVAGHHINVVKALPPLTISESEIRHFAQAVEHQLVLLERSMLRRYARIGLGLGRRGLSAGRGGGSGGAHAGGSGAGELTEAEAPRELPDGASDKSRS